MWIIYFKSVRSNFNPFFISSITQSLEVARPFVICTEFICYNVPGSRESLLLTHSRKETGKRKPAILRGESRAVDIRAKRIFRSRSDSQLRSFVAKFKWNMIEAYVLELHARQQTNGNRSWAEHFANVATRRVAHHRVYTLAGICIPIRHEAIR